MKWTKRWNLLDFNWNYVVSVGGDALMNWKLIQMTREIFNELETSWIEKWEVEWTEKLIERLDIAWSTSSAHSRIGSSFTDCLFHVASVFSSSWPQYWCENIERCKPLFVKPSWLWCEFKLFFSPSSRTILSLPSRKAMNLAKVTRTVNAKFCDEANRKLCKLFFLLFSDVFVRRMEMSL